jgi:hypothetical protein
MKKILFGLLVLAIINKCYSQESAYKKLIDSTLLSRSHKPVKKIKVIGDSTIKTFYYEKVSKELSLIEVVSMDNNRIRWWYNYHFINGEFVMLNKYNGQSANNRKANAFYYFKNDQLIFKEEHKAQMQNLETQVQVANNMRLNAPKY